MAKNLQKCGMWDVYTAAKLFLVASGSSGAAERERRGAFTTPRVSPCFGRVRGEGFNALLEKNRGEEQERFSSFLAPSLKKAQAVVLRAKNQNSLTLKILLHIVWAG